MTERERTVRVGFIGLGKLGLPVAQAMSKKYQVTGYDIRPVHTNGIWITQDITTVIKDSDIIFIAVQTPHDVLYDGSRPSSHMVNKDFDYTYVISVLDKINPLLRKDQIIVLISTVLPGTVRRLLAHRVTNGQLIYNPYLIAMGTVAEDMLNPEMIMIGNESGQEDDSVNSLKSFYQPLMQNNPRIITGTWEEMECTKIFYNTFISAKLGLVNMIQDVSEKIGHINVDIVADALANSTKRIMSPSYMKPGMGDGGPCHPRDNIALRWLAENLDLGYDLFNAIMQAREIQAQNIAKELVRHRLPVVILGKSFKQGVPYTDGSYSVLVGYYVEELGTTVSFDEYVSTPAAYLLAHDIDYTSDKMAKGSVVVDPWRRFKAGSDITVISWGNTRLRQPYRD